MVKKIFSLFFVILVLTICTAPAYAYEPTGEELHCKSGLLVCLDTDEVIYSLDADKKVYPASITKIMTVLLMLESEKYSPNSKIKMTKDVQEALSGTGSSVSNLKAGEAITQLDLVYMVLMASYGDCAYLASVYFGGSVSNFVDMMNKRASELGLSSTHYANPIGLHDEQNYTTANDTYKLASFAIKNKTFKKVCETVRYTVKATNMSGERILSTTNFLQDSTTNYYYSYAGGVKTGYTDEAGRCLVSTASYNGYNYMCILFGCPPNAGIRYEFIDSKNLYRWAFNNFIYKQVADTNEPVCEVPVELSFDTDFVSLYVKEGFISVLPKDSDESTVTFKYDQNPKSVEAPIKKGQILGKADIVYAEKVIGTVDLVAGEDINRSFLLYGLKKAKQILSSVYMKLIYVVAAIIVLIFIILVIRLNSGRAKRRKVKYKPYNERKETRGNGKH